MSLPDGFALIPGRSRTKALVLIKAAEAVGVDAAEIRTTRDGYQVPIAVLEYVEDSANHEDLAIAATTPDSIFDPLDTAREPYAPVSPAAPQPKGVTPSKALKKAADKAAAKAAEAAVQDEPAGEQPEQVSSTAGQEPNLDPATGLPVPGRELTEEEKAGLPVITEGQTEIQGGEVPAGVDPNTIPAAVVETQEQINERNQAEDAKEVAAGIRDADTLDPEKPVVVEPARNASRDDWVTYVKSLEHEEADVASLEPDDDSQPGLTRAELIAKYGSPVPIAE